MKRATAATAIVSQKNSIGNDAKKRKTHNTAMEALTSNLPAPRDVICIHNSDGIKLGLMQQAPLLNDPSFPMTEELLTKFAITDETVRNKLLFFLMYMFDFAREGAVLDGFRQLALGMHRSVDAHRQALDHIYELGVKYHTIIFDLPHAKRILINDFSNSNQYPSAIAISPKRDADNLEELLGDMNAKPH